MSDLIRRKKIQILEVEVGAAGNVVRIEASADKLYEQVTGIAASIIGDETGMNNSVFQQFEIDKTEVFPSGFEAKIIGTSRNQDVPPDEKFYANRDKYNRIIPFKAANSSVNVTYKDGSFAAVAYPYTLLIYLRLENPDEQAEAEQKKFFKFFEEQYQKWLKDGSAAK